MKVFNVELRRAVFCRIGCLRRTLDNGFISTGMEAGRQEFQVGTGEFISLGVACGSRLPGGGVVRGSHGSASGGMQ